MGENWHKASRCDAYEAQIKDLELSPRLYNTLRWHGIETVKQLLRYEQHELLSLSNIGKNSVNEIITVLARKDFVLGTKYAPQKYLDVGGPSKVHDGCFKYNQQYFIDNCKMDIDKENKLVKTTFSVDMHYGSLDDSDDLKSMHKYLCNLIFYKFYEDILGHLNSLIITNLNSLNQYQLGFLCDLVQMIKGDNFNP